MCTICLLLTMLHCRTVQLWKSNIYYYHLGEAVHGPLVLGSTSRGHHHSPPVIKRTRNYSGSTCSFLALVKMWMWEESMKFCRWPDVCPMSLYSKFQPPGWSGTIWVNFLSFWWFYTVEQRAVEMIETIKQPLWTPLMTPSTWAIFTVLQRRITQNLNNWPRWNGWNL